MKSVLLLIPTVPPIPCPAAHIAAGSEAAASINVVYVPPCTIPYGCLCRSSISSRATAPWSVTSMNSTPSISFSPDVTSSKSIGSTVANQVPISVATTIPA